MKAKTIGTVFKSVNTWVCLRVSDHFSRDARSVLLV
jgi:hypothetical protein